MTAAMYPELATLIAVARADLADNAAPVQHCAHCGRERQPGQKWQARTGLCQTCRVYADRHKGAARPLKTCRECGRRGLGDGA